MKRVRIRSGWAGAGRTGTMLVSVYVWQPWAVVLWDDEEDPGCFKLAGLEEIPAVNPSPKISNPQEPAGAETSGR